jgi:hypothetical protein
MDTTELTCAAVVDRKELTLAIQRACSPQGDVSGFKDMPADGSEKALSIAFSVLHGIVNEYLDGGDQMTENCTCGKHADIPRQYNSPATKYFEEGQWPRKSS